MEQGSNSKLKSFWETLESLWEKIKRIFIISENPKAGKEDSVSPNAIELVEVKKSLQESIPSRTLTEEPTFVSGASTIPSGLVSNPSGLISNQPLQSGSGKQNKLIEEQNQNVSLKAHKSQDKFLLRNSKEVLKRNADTIVRVGDRASLLAKKGEMTVSVAEQFKSREENTLEARCVHSLERSVERAVAFTSKRFRSILSKSPNEGGDSTAEEEKNKMPPRSAPQ